MEKEKDMYWQRFLETGQITDYLRYRRRQTVNVWENQEHSKNQQGYSGEKA